MYDEDEAMDIDEDDSVVEFVPTVPEVNNPASTKWTGRKRFIADVEDMQLACKAGFAVGGLQVMGEFLIISLFKSAYGCESDSVQCLAQGPGPNVN